MSAFKVLTPGYYINAPDFSRPSLMEAAYTLHHAGLSVRTSVCPVPVPFTENARYTMLMCRLTGGSPPLQRPARSNRLAVLACVRFQGGPLSPVMPTCYCAKAGGVIRLFVLSVCLSLIR